MLKVIPNCIPQVEQDFLERTISSLGFEWHYLQKSNYNGDAINLDQRLIRLANMKGYFDYPTLSNVLYNGTGNGTDLMLEFFPIIARVLSKDITTGESVILDSMRVNMLLPVRDYPKNAIGNPHVDNDKFGDKSFTALYYVNDSDGDTILYNETYDSEFGDELTEHVRVSPEKGKLIIFNRNRLHSASLPSSACRMVININYNLL